MHMLKKVLMTGAAGTVGRALRERLKERFDLTLVDVEDLGLPNSRRIDVARDYEALREAMGGHDAVVHLALDVDYENSCVNEMMAKNVYRAALATKPHPRVVVTSSIHAVGGYLDWEKEPYSLIARRQFDRLAEMPEPITTDMPLRPNGLYGAAKGYIELLGRYYAAMGIEVLALRLGGIREDDGLRDEPGYASFWLSCRDCAQLTTKAIEADCVPPFSVFFGISNNKYRVHDLADAARALGYEPEDDAEIRFRGA